VCRSTLVGPAVRKSQNGVGAILASGHNAPSGVETNICSGLGFICRKGAGRRKGCYGHRAGARVSEWRNAEA
jgi:hypothetical protein